MGALDMRIVNPARTVIQNQMGVDDAIGIWVITIYTFAYAASIPVMGKLADRHGRKYIHLLCIFLIGSAIGSLFMAFVACDNPNIVTVCATLVLSGLGPGFTMGTPLNYMMFEQNKSRLTEKATNGISAGLALWKMDPEK